MGSPSVQGPYSAVPHAIAMDRRLSFGARTLYPILARYWWRTGECLETHARLAGDLGCSERAVFNYIAELVGAGYVVRRVRPGETNAYAPAEGGTVVPPNESVGRHRSAREGGTGVPGGVAPECQTLKKTPEEGLKPEPDAAAAARASSVELSDEAKPLAEVWQREYGEPFPSLTPALARDVNDTVAAVGFAAVVDAIGWGARNGGKPLASVLKAARTGQPRRPEQSRGRDRTRAAPAANGSGAAAPSIASLMEVRRF